MSSLRPLFHPTSIAVVGASTQPAAISRRVTTYLRRFGYPGPVFAVNPTAAASGEIDGIPCVATLSAVPVDVDLALVFTAAKRVPDVIGEAAASGVRAAVIFSSGFAELGTEGVELQEQVRSIAAAAQMRVLGPNCQGVIHLPSNLVATFTNAVGLREMPAPGAVAYVGQSGAIGGVLFDLLRQRGSTPSAWASTGNQVDVDVAEVTAYLLGDPAIDTVLVYLEQTPEGGEWATVCATAEALGKQVIALHAGISGSGRQAAASHTGSLVNELRSFELVCERHGVLLVDDLQPMIDLAMARRSRVHTAGRRTGIITTSGGAGSITADMCEHLGLGVPALDPTTRAQLDTLLPAFASSANPVDVTAQFVNASSDGMGRLCRLLADDPSVDQLLIVLTGVVGETSERLARSVVEAVADVAAPVSMVYLAAADRTTEARAILRAGGISVYDSIGASIRAIAALATPGGAAAAMPDEPAAQAGEVVLTEHAAGALLDRFGIRRPASRLVTGASEAATAAASMTAPFVLKVQSPDITHKTDVGGVRLGVAAEDVGEVCDALLADVAGRAPGARLDGVLVQEQVEPGIELLVGIQAGRGGYPSTVTVGIGGTAVEIYGDVVTALEPLDPPAAAALLRKLRGWPLLDGHRGAPPADVAAAAAAIAALTALAQHLGEQLVELEVNPLIVHADGVHAADFVCRLRGPLTSYS